MAAVHWMQFNVTLSSLSRSAKCTIPALPDQTSACVFRFSIPKHKTRSCFLVFHFHKNTVAVKSQSLVNKIDGWAPSVKCSDRLCTQPASYLMLTKCSFFQSIAAAAWSWPLAFINNAVLRTSGDTPPWRAHWQVFFCVITTPVHIFQSQIFCSGMRNILHKSKGNLRNAGAKIVTYSKFHTDSTQMLGATVRNLVTTATWGPGI